MTAPVRLPGPFLIDTDGIDGLKIQHPWLPAEEWQCDAGRPNLSYHPVD